MSALGWVITIGATFLAYKLTRLVVRIIFDLMKGDANRLKISYVDSSGATVSKIVELDDDLKIVIADIRKNQSKKKGAIAP